MQCVALIVEDEKLNAEMYFDALNLIRFQSHIVYTGTKAIEWLEANSAPHLVILDINLPELDGSSVYNFIRKHEKFADTQVIIATANAYLANRMITTAEQDAIYGKPLALSELQRIAKEITTRY